MAMAVSMKACSKTIPFMGRVNTTAKITIGKALGKMDIWRARVNSSLLRTNYEIKKMFKALSRIGKHQYMSDSL